MPVSSGRLRHARLRHDQGASHLKTIAVYNLKGGVGKTTIAVNLAWAAATASGRRTLLWDLDAQAAATYILGDAVPAGDAARAVIERELSPSRLIRETEVERLFLLPGDSSIRSLDLLFGQIDRRKRIRKIVDELAPEFDRIILDCPPGLGATTEQLIRAASLIVVPLVPSALSLRGFAEFRQHLDLHHKGGPPLLPVFNMVDRRRLGHRTLLANWPDVPVVPAASQVEAMAERRQPLAVYAPRSPATAAFRALWSAVEQRLAKEPGPDASLAYP